MPVDIADFEETLNRADDCLSVVLKLYNSVTYASSSKGPSQILDVSSAEAFVRVISAYKAAIVAARNKEDTEDKQTYEGLAVEAVLKAGKAFERYLDYLHELFISMHSELVQAILHVVPTHVKLMPMAESLGSSMAIKNGMKETGNKNGGEDQRIKGATTLLEQVLSQGWRPAPGEDPLSNWDEEDLRSLASLPWGEVDYSFKIAPYRSAFRSPSPIYARLDNQPGSVTLEHRTSASEGLSKLTAESLNSLDAQSTLELSDWMDQLRGNTTRG